MFLLSYQCCNAFVLKNMLLINDTSRSSEGLLLKKIAWYCLTLLCCLCFTQPPVAKKDASAVNVAHMMKRADSKTETHTNGSEVHHIIIDETPQVDKNNIIYCENVLLSFRLKSIVLWSLTASIIIFLTISLLFQSKTYKHEERLP